jgi:hypothetical protein
MQSIHWSDASHKTRNNETAHHIHLLNALTLSQFPILNSQFSILNSLVGLDLQCEKKHGGCNNNLEKTLSEKTEKYNTHQ